MATKLEECARAVDCRPWLEDFGGNDATREALRKHSFAVARAVIRCLMEPNEAMLKAYYRCDEWLKSSEGTRYLVAASFESALGEPYIVAMLQSVLDEAGKE